MRQRFSIRRIFISVLSLSSVFLFTTCNSDFTFGAKEEGEIIFDTKGVDPEHPLYDLAPSSATLKFKGEKFVMEMSTMGMFNTSIICDNKNKTMAQTVKFLDIKQACIEHEKELIESNNNTPLKIEETGETKEIIGMKCYKVIVTKLKDPSVKYDAWYTKELGMDNMNALTPYEKVKGMLLDYRIERLGMELHFVAKSYLNKQIPNTAFEVPASMKIVSKPEMQKFINNLQ